MKVTVKLSDPTKVELIKRIVQEITGTEPTVNVINLKSVGTR